MTCLPPRRSDGTAQRRRLQRPWPKGRPFRILSIDGGGICGILPAAVLTELEQRFLGGKSVAGCFDMIAGTSTGGIIALGLSHGKTAREIREIYVERGGLIFPPPNPLQRVLRRVRRFGRYAYDRDNLESELLRIFDDTPFGMARNRLVIPSFEGRYGEPWLYKTPHHPDYKKDRFERMVRVGLATAAAPTFFQALPNNGYMMVDGGLWANNPTMNALVDTLACFEIDRANIQILSLGCGETAFTVDATKSNGGILQWRDIYFGAMRAQSLNALGQAYLLVGKDNVMRIDAPEAPSPIALDDHRRARTELPAMARVLVEAAGHRIEQMFLHSPTDPYVPVPLQSEAD
ncbi:CBASS cGAMP-activated phospholipase [Mesorhizobium sp. M4B.F.Ca.ET.143.01.1.1]|uniref:CBASS cGAMP-activated phospholipase n=1 Tax=Mesorhizobium sp. M4B.F.Ca.ET.143.01.1.1 TaxID=2563947 RepID=UPI0010940930|nr:CBASS cGAMP-activated phospholipase [Mesorhizobium sp. M4B.F.Ca.ET.143.01.1.1]TGV22738.1 patatin [Mesorhizobium sp. M4B.F.Ca.ET.143.01.1.1]